MGKEQVIAIVDVETTGTNPERDRVIEFAVQKGLEKDSYRKSWRVNPGIPIPASATAVHGISDEDLKDCPPFSALLPVIEKIFNGSQIIVGYNLEFDLRALQAEFRRCGKDLDLSGKTCIDPLQLWRACEPRKLEDAVKRFVGVDHTEAHTAEGDVAATGAVLCGMISEFGLKGMGWDELAEFLNPERSSWIGPSHHLRWKDQVPIVDFGKHRGIPIFMITEHDAEYIPWIMKRDFPPHVKEVFTAISGKSAEDCAKWLIEKFGSPPPSQRTGT